MFLNPFFLAGTVLVALPIVLHLLMRPRPKHLLFPALRFIRQRHDVNRRQMRLRNWLLLLLRAAVICLLAVALARPSMQTAGMLGDQEGPIAAALVFDTLPRMEYRNDNKSRLEAAREIAVWLLGQLPDESQVAVLDATTTTPVFQIDLGAARHRIERLETKGVGRPLSKIIPAAIELLKTSEHQRELYLFTDLSAAAWETDQETSLADQLKELSGAGVYVIDVGVEQPQNFSLGEIRLSGQTLAKNSPLGVSTDLSSLGLSGQRVVESYLIDKLGKEEKRSQEIVDAKPGAAVGVEFVLGGLDAGLHQGFLRVVGGDALAADDARFFSVEVRPAWRVLVVAPSPAEDYAFFFTEALAPRAFRKNGQARFEYDVLPYDKLPTATFEPYSAVCLLDPPPLPDNLWQQLAGYALEGGGVAMFLGEAAQPAASFNSAAARELLPAEISLQARHPDGDVSLAPDDSQHPLLTKFRPLRGTIGWDGFPVFRYWQLSQLAEGTNIVMNYDNAEPALVERPLGRGRVLLMTTPVSESPSASAGERWNLLPTGFEPWPFVMLTNELMLYLVGSADAQLNYTAGQTAVLRLDAAERRPTYLLSTPDGASDRIAADQKQNAIVVSSTDEQGNYRIAAGGEEDGVNLGFSVNLPPSATQLQRLAPERLAELFGETKPRIARSREQIDREVSTSRVGRELFPFLIALLAVVLGVEHVLANRFYREK